MKNKRGLGVIEIVILIAILVALALAFRGHIIGFFNTVIEQAFPTEEVTDLDDDIIQAPSIDDAENDNDEDS